MTDTELTDREMAIARRAAKLACQEMTNEFYKQVGKGFVHRFFVVVGAAVVGWLAAKGWIVWKP